MDGWTIEVKHYAKAIDYKPEWWRQVTAAAISNSEEPALVWRGNRQAWRVTVRLAAINSDIAFDLADEPVTLSFKAWSSLVRESLKPSRHTSQTFQSSSGQIDAVSISITKSE